MQHKPPTDKDLDEVVITIDHSVEDQDASFSSGLVNDIFSNIVQYEENMTLRLVNRDICNISETEIFNRAQKHAANLNTLWALTPNPYRQVENADAYLKKFRNSNFGLLDKLSALYLIATNLGMAPSLPDKFLANFIQFYARNLNLVAKKLSCFLPFLSTQQTTYVFERVVEFLDRPLYPIKDKDFRGLLERLAQKLNSQQREMLWRQCLENENYFTAKNFLKRIAPKLEYFEVKYYENLIIEKYLSLEAVEDYINSSLFSDNEEYIIKLTMNVIDLLLFINPDTNEKRKTLVLRTLMDRYLSDERLLKFGMLMNACLVMCLKKGVLHNQFYTEMLLYPSEYYQIIWRNLLKADVLVKETAPQIIQALKESLHAKVKNNFSWSVLVNYVLTVEPALITDDMGFRQIVLQETKSLVQVVLRHNHGIKWCESIFKLTPFLTPEENRDLASVIYRELFVNDLDDGYESDDLIVLVPFLNNYLSDEMEKIIDTTVPSIKGESIFEEHEDGFSDYVKEPTEFDRKLWSTFLSSKSLDYDYLSNFDHRMAVISRDTSAEKKMIDRLKFFAYLEKNNLQQLYVNIPTTELIKFLKILKTEKYKEININKKAFLQAITDGFLLDKRESADLEILALNLSKFAELMSAQQVSAFFNRNVILKSVNFTQISILYNLFQYVDDADKNRITQVLYEYSLIHTNGLIKLVNLALQTDFALPSMPDDNKLHFNAVIAKLVVKTHCLIMKKFALIGQEASNADVLITARPRAHST